MSIAPDWDALRDTPFTEWQPTTEPVLPRHPIPRSVVASIDVHNHLGRWLNLNPPID
jgi:hypothetical protein